MDAKVLLKITRRPRALRRKVQIAHIDRLERAHEAVALLLECYEEILPVFQLLDEAVSEYRHADNPLARARAMLAMRG